MCTMVRKRKRREPYKPSRHLHFREKRDGWSRLGSGTAGEGGPQDTVTLGSKLQVSRGEASRRNFRSTEPGLGF